MKRSRFNDLRCLSIMIATVCLLLIRPTFAQDLPGQEPLAVFVVRHAEKENGGRDPKLSEAGKTRANVLAEVLRDANLKHVHSSDFARTRATAAPIAARLGLEVESYDPRDLAALAAAIQRTGGRHLVVGHSNTTPELVKLLGGQANSDIDDQGEFDRLYVVTRGAGPTPVTLLLHYGQPFKQVAAVK